MKRLISGTLSFFRAPILLLLSFLCCPSCKLSVAPLPPDGPEQGRTPYISEVFDYCYGVGQHSQAHPGIHAKPSDAVKFIGTDSDYVLLGGWGGYIVGGFDHEISNAAGPDFAVYTQPGTGNEQAVVYVMADANGNGRPDDTWYELKGSATDADYSAGGVYQFAGNAYDKPLEVNYPPDPLNKYIRDYELTYYKAVPGGNVTWEDNQGNSGDLKSLYWQDTSEKWWWPYYEGSSKTFTGVKLPHNKFSSDGTYWWDFEDRLTWGYAENYDEYGSIDCQLITFGDDFRKANCFDIANAIDKEGKPVFLSGIRFIKVQSAVFLQAGWLNEVSTEVSGAVDLHWEGISIQHD